MASGLCGGWSTLWRGGGMVGWVGVASWLIADHDVVTRHTHTHTHTHTSVWRIIEKVRCKRSRRLSSKCINRRHWRCLREEEIERSLNTDDQLLSELQHSAINDGRVEQKFAWLSLVSCRVAWPVVLRDSDCLVNNWRIQKTLWLWSFIRWQWVHIHAAAVIMNGMAILRHKNRLGRRRKRAGCHLTPNASSTYLLFII